MHSALMRVVKTCRVTDPGLFCALVLIAYSRMAAEMASEAKIMAPGGIDAMIAFAQNQLGRMMREDFAQRVAAINSSPKH